jgi:GDP-mannose transporter
MLISLDSPDSLYERSLIDDTDKVNQSEERVLKLHELNGVVDRSSSPLKREVVNRYASVIILVFSVQIYSLTLHV